ncbi:uncharacterized protein LOC113848555 [Abrus precatorius]|uniref:Uncharacterized protein LOC113848555 n=1 Tax=Abrus precatorius TaxID=3816 RepID=A0A8B8JTR0_ABRPR|nr:uncharacterized protein LOC113848555 [Abrus precatorius]
MRCIQLQSSLLSHSLHAKHKPKLHHIMQKTQLFWLSTTHQPPRGHHLPSASSLSTKALSHCVVVANAITPPAKSGDISTLLPISAVLLLVYFVGNFVVPGFLTKSFGYDNSNEDQEIDDGDETEEDE